MARCFPAAQLRPRPPGSPATAALAADRSPRLHDLMPPHSAAMAAREFRKRLLTMPAALRHHRYDLIHLLDRQERAEGPTMSGLTTALPASGRRFRPRRRAERVHRWGTRGIRRGLAELRF